MQEFSDDDDGYARWIGDNPTGFVLNVRRNPGASYAMLHRATCQTIARSRDDGAYTGRGYRKVASGSVTDLRHYTRSLGRADGSFSGVCGLCDPFGDWAIPHGPMTLWATCRKGRNWLQWDALGVPLCRIAKSQMGRGIWERGACNLWPIGAA